MYSHAKGIENYFSVFYTTVSFFFFSFFLTHTVSVSLKCVNDLADGFILRARF